MEEVQIYAFFWLQEIKNATKSINQNHYYKLLKTNKNDKNSIR